MTFNSLIKTLIAGVATLGLSACDWAVLGGAELGSHLDEGRFGNPTMNNVLIHTGQASFVEVLSDRFNEEVNTTINFEFDSARLDDAARTVLRQQASWIRQFPEVRFSVYGHTDLVGSNAYNQALGLRRARAAVNYLVSQGVSRHRLEALVSRGENEPVIATQERERQNRRTVTTVSGFVQSHPIVLNGEYARIVQRNYVTSAQRSDGSTGADGG